MTPTFRPTRVLVVANDSHLDRSLLSAVARRSIKSPADFTLLIPAVAHGLHRVVDPEDYGSGEAEAALDAAIPMMSMAAGAPVIGVVGGHDPFAAVWDALNFGAYDEVIPRRSRAASCAGSALTWRGGSRRWACRSPPSPGGLPQAA